MISLRVALGAGHLHDELVSRALLGIVRRLHGRPIKEWRALGTSGAQVRYVGMVVEGV